MKKIFSIILACVFILSVSAIADAKKGGNGGNKGAGAQKSQKVKKKDVTQGTVSTSSSRPHGWSQGKKKGWQGSSYPPGWTKWDKKKKDKWTVERNSSEDEINTMLIRYNIDVTKRTEVLRAYDQAILGGLAINEARKTMVDALKDESTRRGLMIDTAKSVLDLLK